MIPRRYSSLFLLPLDPHLGHFHSSPNYVTLSYAAKRERFRCIGQVSPLESRFLVQTHEDAAVLKPLGELSHSMDRLKLLLHSINPSDGQPHFSG